MNYVAYVFNSLRIIYELFFLALFCFVLQNNLVKHLFTLDLCRVKVYSYPLLPCRYMDWKDILGPQNVEHLLDHLLLLIELLRIMLFSKWSVVYTYDG